MMHARDALTSAQMCHVVGCTFRMLDYWIRTGAISPALDGSGSGTRRLFTHDQVRIVLAVHLLRSVGLGAATAAGNAIDRDTARRIAEIEGPWKDRSLMLRSDGPVLVSLDLGWIEAEAERLLGERGSDRVRVPKSSGHAEPLDEAKAERIRALMRSGR